MPLRLPVRRAPGPIFPETGRTMRSRSHEVLKSLKSLEDPANVAGMARFGISPALAYGVPKPATAAGGEFVKRAGFVLMASLAVHDRNRADVDFVGFLVIIEREAGDGRNYVRKAVNWALRQIGKRDSSLRLEAVRVAAGLRQAESGSARRVGADALRELESEAVRRRAETRGAV